MSKSNLIFMWHVLQNSYAMDCQTEKFKARWFLAGIINFIGNIYIFPIKHNQNFFNRGEEAKGNKNTLL